ncbi:hypothetical protein [Fuchsiella alkaliacetigena]|uniref:hypothetical protein n=1 Tax=Fuchsiella alkaliacetigena TaxID=957042 RepID=UPI00200AFBE7|nr:hypothetical protein [Fuchsiella alkaliacetigena]MCK8823598.1 hypothetical protein [Fuchsiella alkaliacetigena]
MEVFKILAELRSLLEEAQRVPLSNKVLVDQSAINSLINNLEEELPADLREAEQILAQREELIAEAKEKAREEAVRLIAESEVVKEAEVEAEEIVKEAKQMAKEIKEGVREYADQTLGELEDQLEAKLREVRKNRAQL